MGISICLLAMLKLMDVEDFAASFRKCDLHSQSWRSWGCLYPGVELLVGLGMLLRPEHSAATQLVGAVAVWPAAETAQARARSLVSSRASPEAITTRVSTPSSSE